MELGKIHEINNIYKFKISLIRNGMLNKFIYFERKILNVKKTKNAQEIKGVT